MLKGQGITDRQSEEKSDYWLIPTLEILHNEVVFEKMLTKEEAIDAFVNRDYDDIINFESMSFEVLDHGEHKVEMLGE